MGCTQTKTVNVDGIHTIVSLPKKSDIPQRPERSGMWFVVHRKILESVQCAATCNVYDEFWAFHPNGSARLRDFVAVQLTQEMVEAQHDRVRLASYRWLDMKGNPLTPANFHWFLDLCEKNGWIGWMDFLANVGVNVPNPYTIAYMGGLYAETICVNEGLLDNAKLAVTMTRAW